MEDDGTTDGDGLMLGNEEDDGAVVGDGLMLGGWLMNGIEKVVISPHSNCPPSTITMPLDVIL